MIVSYFRRQVSYEEGQQFVKNKMNLNIDEVFCASINMIDENIKNNFYDLRNGVKLWKVLINYEKHFSLKKNIAKILKK